MPNITTNHAITYTNTVIIKQLLDSVFVNIQNNQGIGVPLAPLLS